MTDKLRDAALWKLLTEARETLWQPANPDLCGRIDEALAQQDAQNAADEVWRKLFWQAALKLKCLPSSYPDANGHVLRAIDRLMGSENAQQDAQAELPIIRQNKLLADALASCILASGIVRTDIDGLTGPQLLLFAADLREMLETKKAQQDAQTGSPDHCELYAQGWLNGTQVQSLIDWCNSYPRKLPNVAFTEGTVRQVAYAIHNSLMLQQTKELAFAVDRLKKLVNLVYRGDYSKTETKEWWDHVEKMLKDTQAFCALPYEHLQDCAPDAAPTPPAQEKQS